MRLLLVEDSPSLQRSLSAGLKNSGYSVDQAFDGKMAQGFINSTNYDAIILDLMIPYVNGLQLLSDLRKQNNDTYVLILSAKDTTTDRIHGLDTGADDYLIKPFSFEELLSRIRSMTRRIRSGQAVSSVYQIGSVEINTATRIVLVGNKALDLTPHEYKILELLSRRRGQVISHELMIDRMYSAEQWVTKNNIEVHISTLRKKLRDSGIPGLIKTKRGFGYFIAE